MPGLTPLSFLYSTLSPLRAMSRRLRWQRTLKLHTTLLMTTSSSASGSGSSSSPWGRTQAPSSSNLGPGTATAEVPPTPPEEAEGTGGEAEDTPDEEQGEEHAEDMAESILAVEGWRASCGEASTCGEVSGGMSGVRKVDPAARNGSFAPESGCVGSVRFLSVASSSFFSFCFSALSFPLSCSRKSRLPDDKL